MKVTIVVVLYKQKVEESTTFQTLKETLFMNNGGLKDVTLILYDNSPEKQEFQPSPFEGVSIFYVHDSRNLGVAAAYNYAFATAIENGSEWLLLFDDDTELTLEYVEQVMNLDEKNNHIVAVVPKIKNENQMISPVYSNPLRPLQGERPAAGIQVNPVMAFNSGSLIRVSFLHEIGGFNEEFPLDYLDHWLYHEIYSRGYQVWVLDVYLEHELSVMDYSRVSLTRYKSILESENKYFKKYQQNLYKSYKIHLAKRFLKQILTVKNKKIAFYTLLQLFSK